MGMEQSDFRSLCESFGPDWQYEEEGDLVTGVAACDYKTRECCISLWE